MSRFGFSFGRDNKKNNRHERDDIVLRHEPSSGYDNYGTNEEDNTYYDPRDSRDPRLMRPYRTDDARLQRSPRQRPEHDDDFDDDMPIGFRRTNTSHDDMPRGRYSERDDYVPLHNPAQRAPAGYEQRPKRPSSNNRQAQNDDLRGLGFWHNEESDAQYDDSEADVDRPSPLKFIVAVTGLVFICTVTWLAYRWISLPTSDTPPLIQAETDSYRVRPENPGGTDFPHQDKLIYGRLAPATEQPVERLLPAPEQSVIMAPTYTQPQQLVQPQQPGQQQAQYPQQPYYAHQAQGQAVGQPPQPQVYAAPAYAPTNQPEQTPNQAAAQPAQQATAEYIQHYSGQPYVQSQQPQPRASQYQGPPDLNGLPQNQPQHYQQQMAQNPATQMEPPAPEVKPNAQATLDAIVNTPEAKFIPVDTMLYYLQLGTLPNEALAKKEKERLQKRYANELAGMDLSIKSFVASDGRKKYRILAGPTIVSRKAALDKCIRLGNACQPVRN